MERNKPYYNYAEFIFDFFVRSGCKAGQGGYIFRGLDDRARKAGYNQEQILAIKMLIFNLQDNGYLIVDEHQFVRLTELGYAYMQDGVIEAGRIDLSQYVGLNDNDFTNLWILIGRENIAPFYVSGPTYYRVVHKFVSNIPVSYSSYIEDLKRQDTRLTSRVIWFEKLWKQIAPENRTAFLMDLSKEIEAKYSGIEVNKETNQEEQNIVYMEKKPLLFISYASADKEFATALVTLLEQQGFTHEHVFCSSVDGYGFDVGDDIYTGLLKKFQEYNLFVLFVHSPRFYARPITLNEMGAAWVLKTRHASILTPDMQYVDMNGVVNNHEIAVKVNAEDAQVRMTQMMNQIRAFFGKEPVDSVVWERQRNEFLERVNGLDYAPIADVEVKESYEEFSKEQIACLKKWVQSSETDLYIITYMGGGEVVMGDSYSISEPDEEVAWRDFIDKLEEQGLIKKTNREQSGEPIYRRTGKLTNYLRSL